MSKRLHANNYSTTITTGINNSVTTIDVAAVAGAPAIGNGVVCNFTITDGSNYEIVQATQLASLTYTVVRGVEGTSARSWTAGATFQLNTTADSHDRKLDKQGYTSTATAAGTTTLTVGSTELQYFTGSTTQNVELPVVSTLELGQNFTIVNKSSGVVTVKSSGGNTIVAMAANTIARIICIAITGTSASSWDFSYLPNSSGASATNTEFLRGDFTWANPSAGSGMGFGSYTTTATAGGTTVLTVSSTYQQYFTGTTIQTVTLPVVSTLTLGQSFLIVNMSTNFITIQSSGANTLLSPLSNTAVVVTCISTSGTGTASWSWSTVPLQNGTTGTGDLVRAVGPAFTTPALGVPASGNLVNCTGLQQSGGGTGVSSVTTTPTASAFAGWDTNKNMSANNFLSGYTTTATATAVTTLTVASTMQQVFTGTQTQNCQLPVVSTLPLGTCYIITNLSSSSINVVSSGSNVIKAMASNATIIVQSNATSGINASVWNIVAYYGAGTTGLGGVTDGDKGDITVASSGTVWTIDTPTSATVATDDKVLIKDTSASDATRYATALNVADIGNKNTFFHVYRGTSDQSIASATGTKVQFNTEVADPGNTFDSTTNYRHTPNMAGKYLYIGAIWLSALQDGAQVEVDIVQNATTGKGVAVAGGSATLDSFLPYHAIFDMNGSTDYVEVSVYHTATGNKNLKAVANYSYLMGIRIGV